MFFRHVVIANYSYKCIELERVTVAGSGLMTLRILAVHLHSFGMVIP